MSFNIEKLSDNQDFLDDWQVFLANSNEDLQNIIVQHYVNGKNLACPMPLLKLKMALKTTDIGNWVYLTATDPNSQTDIGAFCRHQNYDYYVTQLDTIFHLLVTKNC